MVGTVINVMHYIVYGMYNIYTKPTKSLPGQIVLLTVLITVTACTMRRNCDHSITCTRHGMYYLATAANLTGTFVQVTDKP